MAKFMDLYLDSYKNGFRRSFLKLKKVQNFKKILENSWIGSRAHLRHQLLESLPKKEKNPLFSHLAHFLIPEGNDYPPEFLLARQTLSCPESRLENIQLQVTTGLDGKNKYQNNAQVRDHIVFEVFPT